jgi:hypothetical protein
LDSLITIAPNLAVDTMTLLFTGISAFYVYHQVTSTYWELKSLLVAVHFLFGSVIVLEVLRNFYSSAVFMRIYTIGGTSFILWDVEILTVVACYVFLRPARAGFRPLISSILRQKGLGPIFIATTFYIAVVNLYLIFSSPFSVVQDRNIWGVLGPSSLFNENFLLMTFSVLVIFILFPSVLFVSARKRTKNAEARHALVLLPLLWSAIGLDLVVVNGYLLSNGIDAVGLGYLLAAVAFGISATLFKKATLLSSFFETRSIPLLTPSSPFSRSVGLKSLLKSGSYLFEVNTSLTYEHAMKDLAIELLSNKHLLFVFTTLGSRIYKTLSPISGARFYIMTSTTMYPASGSQSNQMLVPENDLTILLDTLRKTVVSVPSSPVGIVFDNVSDMIISSGLEGTLKFIKRANEILCGRDNIVSVFLLARGAHEERVVNLIQNAFENHLVFDAGGLKLKRTSEPPIDFEPIEAKVETT